MNRQTVKTTCHIDQDVHECAKAVKRILKISLDQQINDSLCEQYKRVYVPALRKNARNHVFLTKNASGGVC